MPAARRQPPRAGSAADFLAQHLQLQPFILKGGEFGALFGDGRAFVDRVKIEDRAGGGERIGRDAVIVRRTVHGMGMTIRIRIGDYLGIALRELHGARVLLLKHRDPSLSIPLASASDGGDLFDACRDWSETLRLPMVLEDGRSSLREPTARRRRRNAVKARRASILMRRKNGRDMALMNVYRGEREIIART